MSSSLAQKIAPKPDAKSGNTLYDRLGGRQCLERVHKRLYDKIFVHPVFGAFFAGKDQKYQEDQQTDFLSAQFGGPSVYRGRLPEGAHQHLFITDKIFELRHRILAETLEECRVAPELRETWLAIDLRFRGVIVKSSLEECKKRFTMDRVIVAPQA